MTRRTKHGPRYRCETALVEACGGCDIEVARRGYYRVLILFNLEGSLFFWAMHYVIHVVHGIYTPWDSGPGRENQVALSGALSGTVCI